jgi:hypothetical protein
MRRSLLAGIGALAVFISACSPDQPRQEPLAPTDVGLAKQGGGGGSLLCASSLASDITKLQKALFKVPAQLADVDGLFTTIKTQCPMSVPSFELMMYIQRVIDYRDGTQQLWSGPPTIAAQITELRAKDLVRLWNLVTTYAIDPTQSPNLTPLDAHFSVMMTGDVLANQTGKRGGGADVLDGDLLNELPKTALYDLEMTTFDTKAGVKISAGQLPSGPHLITAVSSDFAPGLVTCPSSTLPSATKAAPNASEDCYEIQSYPPVNTWTPKATIGMCILHSIAPAAITHANPNFGTEVLPNGSSFPWDGISGCSSTHTFIDTWLGRKGGPLGRALAKGLDYLRPQPLFADDAGESGLGLFFSPFGGALTVVFDDNFDRFLPPFPVALNTDPTPLVGNDWVDSVSHPGYIQIRDGFGDLTGNVVVISQALGNCSGCPTVALLGTRVNASATDNLGTYEITWQSLQNKSSVKEAPFVVRSFTGAEIARLSYTGTMNTRVFLYNGDTVKFNNAPVGWNVDVHHDFKIIVNLQTLSTTTADDYKTSLAIRLNSSGLPCSGTPAQDCDYRTVVSNAGFKNAATTVSTIGYYLSGIDAGIIAADNFRMKRLPDTP